MDKLRWMGICVKDLAQAALIHLLMHHLFMLVVNYSYIYICSSAVDRLWQIFYYILFFIYNSCLQAACVQDWQNCFRKKKKKLKEQKLPKLIHIEWNLQKT